MITYYEIYLAQDARGTNTVLAMQPGRSKAEAYDLAVKEYRKKFDLPWGHMVRTKFLNEETDPERARLFHLELMERVKEESNGN